MIWFVFLFCLLFRWGILHRVLLVIGWCQVLYASGFLCVSSHYLILPREKGMTEDEMAGWHHRLNGREFEWTPGVGDGQGGLACCDSWACKESDMTEWLSTAQPMKKVKVLVVQLFLALCDPRDYRPPGSSVHGILQARILEWVAIPFSRGSSQPRDQTWVSCIAGRFFTIWAIREAHILINLVLMANNFL